MVRWLAVGREFNVHSSLSHNITDWTADYNIKDYNAVFLDLETLFNSSSEYHLPSSSTPHAINFPDQDAVGKHLHNRNDIFVRLPPKAEISISAPEERRESLNLLKWIPFEIHTDSSEQGEKVNVPVRHFPNADDASQRTWKWYFRPPRFHWRMRILGISPWPNDQSGYSHRVAKALEKDYSTIARRDRSPEKAKLGKIATTNADELVAAKITLESNFEYPGNIYLLPSRQQPFADFVVDILHHWYGYDATTVRTDPSPLWTDEIAVVGEENVDERLSALETKLKNIQDEITTRTKYKKLFYSSGEVLEDLVRDAFREFGFTVEGETPGKWDGVIQAANREYILEVTGTKGGISKGKLSQLDRHRRNYTPESVPSEDVYTLLVANTFKEEHPAKREVHEGNFADAIRGTNKQVMTTKTLYKLLNADYERQIDGDDVQDLILDSEAVIQYASDEDLWSESKSERNLSNRVSTLLNKVTHGFL